MNPTIEPGKCVELQGRSRRRHRFEMRAELVLGTHRVNKARTLDAASYQLEITWNLVDMLSRIHKERTQTLKLLNEL